MTPVRPRALLTALVCALALGACDSPAGNDVHPVGVVFVRADGSEAARYEHPATATGRLEVGFGSTVRYTVRVLDETGATRPIDGVEFAIEDPMVVTALAATVAIEAPDRLVFVGRSALPAPVTTTLQLDLLHAGHAEFTARNIPLRVQ